MPIRKNKSMNEIEKDAVDFTNLIQSLPLSKISILEDTFTKKQLAVIESLCEVVIDECGKN